MINLRNFFKIKFLMNIQVFVTDMKGLFLWIWGNNQFPFPFIHLQGRRKVQKIGWWWWWALGQILTLIGFTLAFGPVASILDHEKSGEPWPPQFRRPWFMKENYINWVQFVVNHRTPYFSNLLVLASTLFEQIFFNAHS